MARKRKTKPSAPPAAAQAPAPAVAEFSSGASGMPIYPRLPVNKLKKFRAYLSALKENVSLHDPKDIEQARILELKMEKIEKHIFTLMAFRTAAYVLLYASVISSIVAGFTWLQELTRSITFFSSIIGSGVLFLCILFLNQLIDSHFSDLHLMASHLIAIYVKNEDGWRPRILEFIEQSF